MALFHPTYAGSSHYRHCRGRELPRQAPGWLYGRRPLQPRSLPTKPATFLRRAGRSVLLRLPARHHAHSERCHRCHPDPSSDVAGFGLEQLGVLELRLLDLVLRRPELCHGVRPIVALGIQKPLIPPPCGDHTGGPIVFFGARAVIRSGKLPHPHDLLAG